MTIDVAELRGIRLLSGLAEDELARLASRLTQCDFLSRQVILSRVTVPEAIYFILAGTVRVELQEEHGQIFNLVELGPGEVFGERSLLTGEPRTADVRALSEVRAARLGRQDFEALLPECPRLYANLCRDFARQLGTWAQRHQRDERENREVLANVIGWQLIPEFGSFPGSSPWVRQLNARLAALGNAANHVLILGERGTWKDLAARLIHFHGAPGRPILFLDCATPPLLRAVPVGASVAPDALHLELAQESALFGHAPDSTLSARRARRGMLELAAGGEMILRNVDCLTLGVQAALLGFLDSGRFRRHGEVEWRLARVRIIATCGELLGEKVARHEFLAGLQEKLQGEVVELLPLRERQKDIPVIARSLLQSLNAKHHKGVKRFSQEALNRLVGHDWPLNCSELYQVLSRAVVVCASDEITAEQIFLSGQSSNEGRFNLLTLPAIERLARRPDFPGLLRRGTIPLLLAVILYTLFGPSYNNLANLAVWTVWWPLLLVTAFFGARSWCSFCPLEGLSAAIGATRSVRHDPAGLLRRCGPSLSLAALAMILLLEQASGMFSWALATGLLLTWLLVATVTADLLLGRRGWCKYLCPLGRVVSLVARISLLEMRSTPHVCVSRCRVDDCIKEKACPMGLHPSGIDNSDHCILCLDCVRHCPHHSMQLDLRNPASGLFSQTRRSFAEALFSVIFAGVVLAAKGTPLLVGRQGEVFPTVRWSPAEVGLSLTIVAAYFALAMLASLGRRGRWRVTFTLCGFAYLPLAMTGIFVIYLRALAEGGAQIVPLFFTALGLAGGLDLPRLTPELGTLRLLIPPLLLGSAAISWVVLGRLRQYNLSRTVLSCHRALVVLTAIGFLWVL
ncbi:MAG: cyclic nucleotide-binding protein [Deltaproteobacteria bacterium HGW-Deltaproteobacteria-4]|nr:MAG: cyclic nucleotide-binding protein [Deltaproteobacteria bacterium HGW-Deltaproteobacteria-4]